MSIESCPVCHNKVYVDSRCFDCKQPIQWICYNCQWESNIRDHNACHKDIVISTTKPVLKSKVENNPIDTLVTKGHEAYWWTIREATEALA